MVYKCCVSNCRGNSTKGPKVHIFSFPKGEELKRKWISAINRKGFQPSVYSRVCHTHFKDGDVLWETSFFDIGSGVTFTAPIDRPRLKNDAIPCFFPRCPSYLSTTKVTRKSPKGKRMRLEERDSNDPEDHAIEAAEEQSMALSYVAKTKEGMTSSIQRIANMTGLENRGGITQNSIDEAAQAQSEKTVQLQMETGREASSQPQKYKKRKKDKPKVFQAGERKSQRLLNAYFWSGKRHYVEDEEPYEELPAVNIEMDWNSEIDCGPTLVAELADQVEQRTSQGGAVEQLNAKPESGWDPDSMRDSHGEDAEPSEEQCLDVVKTEMEWDYETDSGPILSAESENEKHGHAVSKLEEGAGCSHSLLHIADALENQSSFGVQSHDSTENSLPENVGDHSKVEMLCRLCLAELNSFTYIYEFDDIHMFHVADAIKDVLGMALNPDDGYPTKICNACLEELAHFRHFKGKCFNSKAKLKDIVEGNNYHAEPMKSGDGVSLFEHEDNVIDEIPVLCEAEEIIPESREANMFLDSCQSRSVVGESQEDVPNSSQQIGSVAVKKEFFIFCHPANASDERDDAFESDVTERGSGLSSEHRQGNNYGKIIGCDKIVGSMPQSPSQKNEDTVPIKIKIPSNDEQCNNEEVCHGKGETLVTEFLNEVNPEAQIKTF